MKHSFDQGDPLDVYVYLSTELVQYRVRLDAGWRHKPTGYQPHPKHMYSQ